MAIIIVKNYGTEEEHAIGPFASGEEASHYGFANLQGHDWYWLPLNAPIK